MVSCHYNHSLAEYIFCLSLCGLLVDWLECRKGRKQMWATEPCWVAGEEGGNQVVQELKAHTELNGATWKTTLWYLYWEKS